MACHLLGPCLHIVVHLLAEHADAVVGRQVVEDVLALQLGRLHAKDVDLAQRRAALEGRIVEIDQVCGQRDGLQLLAVGETVVGKHGVLDSHVELVEVLDVRAAEPVLGGCHRAKAVVAEGIVLGKYAEHLVVLIWREHLAEQFPALCGEMGIHA